jgi:hypothetical protein
VIKMKILNKITIFLFGMIAVFLIDLHTSYAYPSGPVTADLYSITCYETNTTPCITIKGNGGIGITIMGPREVVSTFTDVSVDPTASAPTGYEKHTDFFIYDNGSSTTGIGIINGLMYYKDPNNIQYYTWEGYGFLTVTHYSAWLGAVQ